MIIMAKMIFMQKSIDSIRNQLIEVLKVNSVLKKKWKLRKSIMKNGAMIIVRKEIIQNVNVPSQINNNQK